MSLSMLFDGKFEEYFAKAGSGTPLWMMVHVPKTAGSSLGTELCNILKPNYNINIRNADEKLSHVQKFEQAVTGFLEAAESRDYRFVTGHITGDHARRIAAALPDVRSFAMLRQPVSRFVSDFRYQRTTMHPGHEDFRARYPTFISYVQKHNVHNKITSHLVPKAVLDTKNADACVDHIMKTFTFIGLQEAYGLSFRAITTLVGTPKKAPTEKQRVNTPNAETAVEVTPELEREIKENNPIDVAVVAELSKRFRNIREGLAEYIRAREAARPPGVVVA